MNEVTLSVIASQMAVSSREPVARVRRFEARCQRWCRVDRLGCAKARTRLNIHRWRGVRVVVDARGRGVVM